jgi:TfuA protein
MDEAQRTVIFAGPSLHGVDVPAYPPVRAGDLRALPDVARGDWTITIIDGEFRQSLAVPLTEIRDVLAAGNRVVGGSSMGALRAVECAPLGMEGVGWIFEGYRDGRLWSDAEVALTYDSDSYEPLTVPMVNLRWLSCLLGAADDAETDAFLAQAAAIPFRYRDVATLREFAPTHWLAELCDERRPAWDRKQADARAVIEALDQPRRTRVWRPAPPDLPLGLRGVP